MRVETGVSQILSSTVWIPLSKSCLLSKPQFPLLYDGHLVWSPLGLILFLLYVSVTSTPLRKIFPGLVCFP